MYHKLSVTVTGPVALDRNREWSLLERAHNHRLGDASFADYVITTSISYRF